MFRFRRVVAMLIVVLPLALAGASGAEQPPVDGVDASVQVTATPQTVRAHAVPSVAVHPDDSRTLAIGSADAFASTCGVSISTNAGLSWTTRPLPVVPEWPSCVFANFGSIVDVAFAGDGMLLAAFSAQDPSTYQSQIHLARSADLGTTWELTALPRVEPNLSAGEFGADALPSLAVDPASPNRVYVGWMTNNGTWNTPEDLLDGQVYFDDIKDRAYVAASSDGGATFGPATDVASEMQGYHTEPHLVVDGTGAVHAFFGTYTGGSEESPMGVPYELVQATSTDGGATFSARGIFTQANPTEEANWLSAVAPGVAADGKDLYVAWEEMGDEPATINFMRSSDDGATWNTPTVLNDILPQRTWGFNEMLPSMSVAPNGRIDVAWYDWRDDITFDDSVEEPTNALQQVYLTSSNDGGLTWSPDIRVTDRAIDRRLGIVQANGLAGPVGLASTDRAAFVAWDDTRNSSEDTGSQDVYFTRVRYAPAGEVFGSTGGDNDELVWGIAGFVVALGLAGLAGVILGLWSRKGRAAVTSAELAKD